jgi:phage terminase small subunit
MNLTEKQEAFCREYLKDFNATQAYKRAGYRGSGSTASTEGAKLLHNPKIQAFLSQLRSRISRNAEVTLERTLQEIARLAFSNVTDVLSFNADGVTFYDSGELPEDVTAAIESVNSVTTVTRQGKQEETRITMKAKMHSKVAALSLLADFFGIKDDFNKARATLKRYGLLLVEDAETPAGWRVVADDVRDDNADVDAAIDRFTEAVHP